MIEDSALQPAPERSKVRQAEVSAEDAGLRLDKYLSKALPQVPLGHVFRLIRKGEVRVNGKRAQGSQRLQAGDLVRIPPVRTAPLAPAPDGTPPQRRVPQRLIEEVRACVLHRDDQLLAVNKPAGLAVHGGSGVSFGLIEALRAAYPDDELELVHRLDRDTSGCLVLGRNRRALRKLGELFAGNKVGKTYWAIVEGRPAQDTGTIDMALLKVTGRQGWRIVPDPTGQPARTDYKVMGGDGRRAWLELTPHTGRTHQIRIHCAELGFPVVGDPIYGPSRTPAEPLMLHARAVSVPIESGKAMVAVQAPPPDHMKAALKSMGWTDA